LSIESDQVAIIYVAPLHRWQQLAGQKIISALFILGVPTFSTFNTFNTFNTFFEGQDTIFSFIVGLNDISLKIFLFAFDDFFVCFVGFIEMFRIKDWI